MKKKRLALLMALMMLLSLLSGCKQQASPEAEYLYDLMDEMLQTKDAQLQLSVPYHGAALEVSGFVSRSDKKADLLLSLSGTEEGDGVYTELRMENRQMWLNVSQLAEQTMTFPMYDYYRSEIEYLYEEQFADWIIYEADETFWSGIPGWGGLLLQLWEDTKEDVAPYVTGTQDAVTVTLSKGQMQELLVQIGERISAEYDSYAEGFSTFARQENELMKATGYSSDDLFESLFADLESRFEAVGSGETSVSGGTFTLQKTADGYDAALELEDGQTWSLSLSAPESTELERPLSVMEFEAYGDTAFYLVKFADTYIGNMLDGAELDEQQQQLYEEEQEGSYTREDMVTVTVDGYDDLSAIRFVPDGGYEMIVPILPEFLGNAVEPVEENSAQICDLSLVGNGWEQAVYFEAAEEKSSSYFLEDKTYSRYDTLINVSGCMLVQDLSDPQTSSDGRAMTQGFAYRSDAYDDICAIAYIVLPQNGVSNYTVMEFEFYPDLMSAEDREAALHLFESMGLDCPVDLGE